MTDTIKENNELDNYGLLTDSWPKNAAKYSIKDIKKYCKEKGKSISDMTLEEFEEFRKE